MDYTKFNKLEVNIYGKLEPYSQTISKGRCRIFYKGANRNGTYITDEFANKLISTIAYTPVKGIYSADDSDYTDHGKNREEGKIYGIVPEKCNFSWEIHLDKDGIEREYACVDVLIYTSLYKEASEIIGKPQSMEIYSNSIKGEYKIIDGEKYFIFQDGCFLGLQVLGNEVEPCFEGAQFFSLYTSIKQLLEEIKQYSKGDSNMDKINFKLSDDQKYCAIWEYLNPNFDEEHNYELNYEVLDVYDEYAISYNRKSGEYERIYYTKDDSNDTVVINARKKCYIIDVTQEEKEALEKLHQLNKDTYEKVDELYTNAQNQIETLTKLNQDLNEYKLNVENKEKTELIDSYSSKLNEENIEKYRAKIAEFTFDELKKELAVTLVESNPSIFQCKDFNPIPKSQGLNGIEAILEKHKNKNNN